MRVFFSAFGIVFLAELADKSRIVGLMLAATYRAPWRVFWGMTLGYVLLDGAAVAAGRFSGPYVSSSWLAFGVGLLFVAFGAAALLLPEGLEEQAKRGLGRLESWGPFAVSFIAIAASELGDRTQVASAALAAETGRPWAVFGGVIGALALLNALTVWLGPRLAARLNKASAVVFIAAGLAILRSA
jgi:Ca2+/H+ antiporter, TMEM165/GDT1 family